VSGGLLGSRIVLLNAPFPIRLGRSVAARGFVPDYSDGVAADSHAFLGPANPEGPPGHQRRAHDRRNRGAGDQRKERPADALPTEARGDRYMTADASWAGRLRAGDAIGGVRRSGLAGGGGGGEV